MRTIFAFNLKATPWRFRFAIAGILLIASIPYLGQSNLRAAHRPLSLHPDNRHYFILSGKPEILITSGEHYGAVVNLDFDYLKYLDTLQADGLNLTRTFSGAYVEPQGAFNISHNTLAPAPGRFIAPWARSTTPGYAGGGNKFDLTRWDRAYFRRLQDFVLQAARRGIIVELNLFCPFYEEAQWSISPLNADNNVNGLGKVTRTQVYTMDQNGGLLAAQEAMVRKIVSELRGFDNLYYEICNEPYFGGVTLEWQHHTAQVIADAEKLFRARHLISQNIANYSAKVDNPDPNVSIINFHYATPPVTVTLNYGLNKVVGDNETGFRGTGNDVYRMEGWDFILAGGGLYNNLDYSFTAGHEDGTYEYPDTQPGGGSPALRKQLGFLRSFINGFNFVKMAPADEIIKSTLPSGVTVHVLAEQGKAYAIYFRPEVLGEFAVSWAGFLESKYSEEYTFTAAANGMVRLWLNGQKIIDNWNDPSGNEQTGTIYLESGKRFELTLEYAHLSGPARLRLFWSSRNQPKELVSSNCLFQLNGKDHGLGGKFFADVAFKSLRLMREDPSIDFDWGYQSPFAHNETAGNMTLSIELPTGDYQADWIDPKEGAVIKKETFRHEGGVRKLVVPLFEGDLALRLISAR